MAASVVNYAQFYVLNGSEKLEIFNTFYKDLTLLSPENDLQEILDYIKRMEEKKTLGYKVAKHADSIRYLITINAKNDMDYQRISGGFQLPRGCCFIWSPGHIEVRGFYPKFSNDKKSKTQPLDASDILEVTIKWSGFLIQIGAFEVDETNYWFACTKKMPGQVSRAEFEGMRYSVDFISLARELIELYMTPELVQKMITNRIYIGAEGLHPDDNTHGYIANMPTVVVTCVSIGIDVQSMGDEVPIKTGTPIKYYMSLDVKDFCIENGFPYSPVLVIEGTPAIRDFMDRINSNRDFCNYDTLAPFFEAEVAGGALDHRRVVGTNMEGLVLKFFRRAPAWELLSMIKVKFLSYVSITMCLRVFIEKFMGNFCSDEALKFIKDVVDTWARTPRGREYFTAFLKACASFLTEMDSFGPSTHVMVARFVSSIDESEMFSLAASLDTALAPLDDAPTPLGEDPVIIAILGPIGVGKSSLTHRIETLLGDRVHITDGDSFAPCVPQFRTERNMATISNIVMGAMQGKVSIFSGGGGVFCEKRDAPDLKKQFEATLNRKVKGIVVIVNASDGAETKITRAGELDMKALYTLPDKQIKSTLTYRKNIGIWTPDVTFEHIKKVSEGNVHMAEKLSAQADEVWTVTLDTTRIRESVFSLTEFPFIPSTQPSPTPGYFKQARAILIAQPPKGVKNAKADSRHVTIFFSTTAIKHSYGHIEAIKASLPDKIAADIYELSIDGTDGKIQLGVIDPSFPVVSGAPHITIESQPLSPGQMVEVTRAINNRDPTLDTIIPISTIPKKGQPSMLLNLILKANFKPTTRVYDVCHLTMA